MKRIGQNNFSAPLHPASFRVIRVRSVGPVGLCPPLAYTVRSLAVAARWSIFMVESLAEYMPQWAAILTTAVISASVLIGFVGLSAFLYIWAERKVSGRIQDRLGPTRVGPIGILQSLADGIKLITKED